MKRTQNGPAAPRYAGNVAAMTVTKPSAGKTLQDFLAAAFGLSRRTAKAVIDGRHVWVNRKCVWIAHHALQTGDTVEVPRAVVSAAKRQSVAGQGGKSASAIAVSQGATKLNDVAALRHVRVLLQTEQYLVADKPAGILTNEDAASVEAVLRVQEKLPHLVAVHRLDRDTTGCLLMAKNHAAYLAAVEIFKTHKVTKIYRAIVVGRFPHTFQLVEVPLDGKKAVSKISREAVGDEASFLKVRIETGRTNQIRRHLASIRYPIAGDRTFGLKTARDARLMTLPRQMLHAAELSLPNPLEKGSEICAKSPLPADFRAALRLFNMGRGRK